MNFIVSRKLATVLSLLLINIFLLLGGCSSRTNFHLYPIQTSISTIDSELVELLEKIQRSDALYRDYRTVMIGDAIFKDRLFRARYGRELKNNYLFSKYDLNNYYEEQNILFQNQFDFIVFLYGEEVESFELEKAHSPWRIFLKDDDGDVINPTGIYKLDKSHRELSFLTKNIRELDRWVEVYSVTFPKFSKGAINEESGSRPFQLILSSMKGKLTFKWENSKLFYQ